MLMQSLMSQNELNFLSLRNNTVKEKTALEALDYLVKKGRYCNLKHIDLSLNIAIPQHVLLKIKTVILSNTSYQRKTQRRLMTFCKHQMSKTNYQGELEIVNKKVGKISVQRNNEVGGFEEEELRLLKQKQADYFKDLQT